MRQQDGLPVNEQIDELLLTHLHAVPPQSGLGKALHCPSSSIKERGSATALAIVGVRLSEANVGIHGIRSFGSRTTANSPAAYFSPS